MHSVLSSGEQEGSYTRRGERLERLEQLERLERRDCFDHAQ
jgi:hypothetical protein